MRAATRQSSRPVDALRGLAALVTTSVLIGGVPIALVRWVGSPLPTEVPGAAEIVDALRESYIPDEFLIKALAVVCWLVWAQLVVSLVVEVVAYARGRKAAAVPLAGGVQAAAARLIATVALLGVLAGTRGTPGVGAPPGGVGLAAPPPVVTLVAAAEPATGPHDATAPATAGDAAEEGPLCEVKWRDTLWDIAERHLGDPLRWSEIFALNEGRLQPDGGCLTDPDRLEPGWQLVLPADARPAQAAEPRPVIAPTGATEGSSASPAVDGAGMILLGDGGEMHGEADGPEEAAGTTGGAPGAGAAPVIIADLGSPPGPDPRPVTPAATSVPAPSPSDVTVAPGDSFWRLAEAQLAAAWGREPTDAEVVGYWQQLIDENRARLAPPGDPDLIHPGQVFAVPAPPTDPASMRSLVPAGSPGGGAVATPDAADDCDPAAADPPTGTGPAEPDLGDGSAGAAVPLPGQGGGGPPAPGPGADPPGRGSEQAASVDDESAPLMPVGLVGGGVALAGALVLLERRRRAQMRHRHRGRVVPLPSGPARAGEAQLRWGAEIQGARLLDAALRAAASGVGATGLPPLRWVEVRADAAVLVLAAPSPAPMGFVSIDGDRWMSSASPGELASAGARVAAPLPALVPVGTTEHGTELLVDLESSGFVVVDGAADDVLALLRALVVAASTSLWSDQPRVVVVGLEGDLGRLPGVDCVASLVAALDLAEAHADRAEASLRSLRCPSVAQARAVGATPEAWDPLVVVAAMPPHDIHEQRRVEALARRSNSAVALVIAAPAGGPTTGRRFAVGDDGWLTVDGVDEPVRPRRLGAREITTLIELLEGADGRGDVALDDAVVDLQLRRPRPVPPPPPAPDVQPPAVVGGDRRPLDDPRPPSRAGAGARVDGLTGDIEVLVKVLGEVEAVRLGPGGEEKLVPTRQRGLEAITYLAMRESAVDREDLEASLFPDGANASKTIYNTVSAARNLLGDDLFPPPSAGRYELSPAVATDYGLFCDLVAEADETDDPGAAADLLTEALRLVRGEPFTGAGRGYAWVGPHRGIIVAQVVDAAEELAEVRLAVGDWRSAEWAARQGLRAFPSDERMYRLLMRTARAAGNIPGVQRVYRELCDVLADPDVGTEPEDTVHPETIELLEELTGTLGRRRGMGA
ncbi:MAG TPA: BTAD domain-containing putative transcriptional regulator [Acidimicrobiales bacterium]